MPKDDQDSSFFRPFGISRTDEQKDIQNAKNKVVLIEANAGAAKTTTLALRIGESVARNVDPESILVLVFTETAREVMRQRLLDIGVHYSIVNKLKIYTFECFAREQLALIEDKGVEQYSTIRQHYDAMSAAIDSAYHHHKEFIEGGELSKSSIAISQFLDAQLQLKARMLLPDSLEREDLSDIYDRFEVTPTQLVVAFEYERIRVGNRLQPKFRGAFDATYDLAKDVSMGVDRHSAFKNYRVVICDELHDLNEAAFRILTDLIDRPNCYFTGAGDRDQVIHATLGASHEYLSTRFKQQFPTTKGYPLTITHRHGPHLAYCTESFKGKAVESNVAEKTEIKVETYVGGMEEGAKCVINAVKKWQQPGFSLDGCAILIRDRHHSIPIENALREAGIGYRTPVMGSYLQREEILFLRGIMAIALRDFQALKRKELKEAIVDALDAYGGLRIPQDTLQKAKAELLQQDLHWFYERYIRNDEKRIALDMAIRLVIDAHAQSTALAADVLRKVCDLIKLKKLAEDLYIRRYDANVVLKSIEGFLSIAGSQTLMQFWDAINAAELFASGYRDKTVLTLDCVANSKGKEFEHVILPYVEANEYPNPLFPIKDEENLFYVGVTRARRWLTLVTPDDRGNQSPFIKRMNISGTKARANRAQERNENAPIVASPSRHYLRQSYSDIDYWKSLGARFDSTRKKWYVPDGMDLTPFKPWL